MNSQIWLLSALIFPRTLELALIIFEDIMHERRWKVNRIDISESLFIPVSDIHEPNLKIRVYSMSIQNPFLLSYSVPFEAEML
jgi:hypothetical protein